MQPSPITNPKLIRRLQLPESEFEAFACDLAERIGAREYSASHFERALAYPWDRPRESFLLSGGDVSVIVDTDRDDLLARAFTGMATDGSPVHPLLTFGSNGAPAVLARKLESLPESEREVLVLAGRLHGYDIGFSAHFAFYGSLPATIIPSPGTGVRAALLWVTAAQLEALTWTEFSYAVAMLPGESFTADLQVAGPDDLFAFVSRNGNLRIDGEDVAMAAVPATDRFAPAIEQSDALSLAADMVLGEPRPELLVRRVIEDYPWAVNDARPLLAEVRNAFVPDDWPLVSFDA
jgi:hypothetical protein